MEELNEKINVLASFIFRKSIGDIGGIKSEEDYTILVSYMSQNYNGYRLSTKGIEKIKDNK